MRVRYTPGAFADRERIIEYLQERSPGGAHKVAASIRDAVAQLSEHPLSGYRTDAPEVRVLFIVRYPCKIFYQVRETVEILHIRRGERTVEVACNYAISTMWTASVSSIEWHRLHNQVTSRGLL